ncbi:MAG: HAD-IIB family hydrolase [Myxococcales bacterium]
MPATAFTPPEPRHLSAWAEDLDLPEEVVLVLCRAYAPLAAWLGERRRTLGRPIVVGVNGAQGTGKSTLLALLTRLLAQQGTLRGAGLSLDDLYLTAAQRADLGRRVHPLLATRGVPGTHDLELAHGVLDALTRTQGPVALPTFDKARDDRAPRERWPTVQAPCDVVVLEGWCVGARSQESAELAEPVNALEREQDADGGWRRFVNAQLEGSYATLFARLDALVMLTVPDMDCVRRWRIEQEHALFRRLQREGRPGAAMDDAAVERFVQFFERLTCAILEEMPGRADVVFELDRDHRIVNSRFGDSGRPAQLVVFSDLDGTLLDHSSYDFTPAVPALWALRQRGAVLVLATSKTRDEVLELREALGHDGPFVVENGGAAYVPGRDGLREHVLGASYAEIRAVLLRLRSEGDYDFEGFGDVDAGRVAEWTGLPAEAAARARARASSEPLRFHGDAASLDRFREALGREGLSLVRGGRFFSVQGPVDKGRAARFVLGQIALSGGGPFTTLGLGDSDNDAPMLEAVDFPVVIPPGAEGRAPLRLSHPRAITAPQPGPAGFRAGVERVLQQIDATG